MSVVYALATPAVKSAICIFRVSGKGCHNYISEIFGLDNPQPRRFLLCDLKNNETFIDRVGLILFKGPESYTGEDSFEVYAHGSLGVMSLIVDLFDSKGFDQASPGEFTKRAFINGKINLNEAESLSDFIESASSREVFLSGASLFGDLSKKLSDFSERINSLRVRVEAEIDFSDEGQDFMDGSLFNDLSLLIEDFGSFVSLCINKREYSNNKNIVLVGPTNSGKSSIFNRLLGYERAIVTDAHGTTRDMISSEVFFQSNKFSIFDSAGIRETEDVIEKKGIETSIKKISDADLVLGVFEKKDATVVSSFKKMCDKGSFFIIQNKIDINSSDTSFFDCCVSAKTGEGFNSLKNLVVSFFERNKKNNKNSQYLIRDRHVKLFNQVIKDLDIALKGLNDSKSLELVAEDLKNARSGLDEILGKKFSDSLLGDIFSSFCIGK